MPDFNLYSRMSSRIQALLDVCRVPVGVKVYYDKDEFDKTPTGHTLHSAISYCSAVKLATQGRAIKMTRDTCSCTGAARALGFEQVNSDYLSGRPSCELGLFEKPEIAGRVARKLSTLEFGTEGVLVAPLEIYKEDPNVVLIITNSYGAMRVMQGYTCTYGLQDNLAVSGNQAICIECTSNPIIRNALNISFMCSGTRFYSRWDENEIGIGIPFSKLAGCIDGLLNTLNATENAASKERISHRLQACGEDISFIDPTHTYYLKLAKQHQEDIKK